MLWMYLRPTAINRESSNPPASFPKGVWEYVARDSSHLTERWSSVHEYTSAGALTHRQQDKQTRKEKQTDTRQGHKTQTHRHPVSRQRWSSVQSAPVLVNYVLSWKTMTFQHSKQTFWHLINLLSQKLWYRVIAKYGLAGKECVAASALCPNMVMHQNLPGNCTMVPSWLVCDAFSQQRATGQK